jgi:ParB-like chromosome segregation protein Spo0J
MPSVPVDSLTLYSRNARHHPPDQLTRLADSLRRFGFVAPVLVDAEQVVIAGHGRIAAARSLWDAGVTIPRCEAGMIPTLQVDHLTPAQVRAYRIADNKLAALSHFDDAALSLALRELTAAGFEAEALGFDDEELRLLTQETASDGNGADDDAEFGAPIAGGVDPYTLLSFSCLVSPTQRDGVLAHLARLQERFGAASPGQALVGACRRFTLI